MRQGQRRHCAGTGILRTSGFTLIEMMFAIVVLAIGMLGAMALLLMGLQSNSSSKTDTTATVLDQQVVEFYSTLKNYPRPVTVTINDCALNGNNAHLADLGKGASPVGAGAVLYTAANAPTVAQIGDINWTAAPPVFATGAAAGYAMRYQTCSRNMYEVRWNVMDLTPAVPPAGSSGRLTLLTVSARPVSAVDAAAGNSASRAVMYAAPVTLRTLIED